ncbi:hypothetical protein TPHA_0N01600 [Tetrapisispora phaffii CBS 4417]|uniref:Uncharacterized protein n=1 Tax=Tetrapisispora phaffii (strain ATCC 24235 / CBS 4417 / NBRC 1672 / NRRL Y-8282 / UCD 70-5) TaxID=1071381 RepID=G8C1B3_TETPH|nr:hypothetical protein TPHA_0N01600 [Tetrapisispora phaffii CBS 4417]CCE65941.1 hypothetical protein TPHA_0N01600 [Tetrapisispora phaffii CBS 4417]
MKFTGSNGILLGLLACEFAVAYKPVIEPKEKLTTTEQPKPWIRTIYESQVEIVTPTIIDGVTFSAKPETPENPLKPWVSLKNNGKAVTIKPELKNGITKKARPDYSTYFMDVTTKTYSYEDLKAHNMKEDEVHEEEIFIPEDGTYVNLNPIIRCVPDRYFEKGKAKNDKSAPFCTPHENNELKVDNTYFLTWYTRFFLDPNTNKYADKVKIHLTYVAEDPYEKGYHNKKRTDESTEDGTTFFSSEWLDNVDGVFPLVPQVDWLAGTFERKIMISIQPNYITDADFSLFENGLFVYIIQGSRVFKQSKEQRELEQAGLHGKKWYYIAISIPSAVLVSVFCMYLFIRINKGYRDFSNVTAKALKKKHRVIGNISEMSKYKNLKNRKYSELPTYSTRKSD